jgi:hypothetical protein
MLFDVCHDGPYCYDIAELGCEKLFRIGYEEQYEHCIICAMPADSEVSSVIFKCQ